MWPGVGQRPFCMRLLPACRLPPCRPSVPPLLPLSRPPAARRCRFAGKPTPDEAIFATVYPGEKATGGGKGKGLYPGWDKDLHYAVSLDFFKTPAVKTVPCGNLFEARAGQGRGVCTCASRRAVATFRSVPHSWCPASASMGLQPGVDHSKVSALLLTIHVPRVCGLQIVAKKVFLAVPSECPVGPDGKARKTPKASVSGRTGGQGELGCCCLWGQGVCLCRARTEFGATLSPPCVGLQPPGQGKCAWARTMDSPAACCSSHAFCSMLPACH